MKLLGYAKYQRFQNTINKAKVSCANGEESVESHFFILGKMVERAQDGGREQEDYRLSRYACCLIAQNGDPRKEQIASAQKYFVIEPIWDLFLEYKAYSKAVFSNLGDIGRKIIEP